MKGKSSIWIAQNVERKMRNFLGHEFWARGYFSGDLVDLGGQPRDQRGDVGFILGGCRTGGLLGWWSCSMTPKRDGD
jgi:hypothetical protein